MEKIYGGTSDGYPQSHMFIYDPSTQSFTDLGTAGIEIYCLTTGKDSLIYGGSYKTPTIGAHFFIYNPQLPWNPGNTPGNNPYDLGPAIPNPSVPSEAIIYDVATGTDGKIYGGTGYAYDVGVYDYARIFFYDPATNQITVLASFSGEIGVIALTIGADGKVYGSLTPSGKVFIYDPTTGNIIYLGIPLPNNTIRGLTTSQDGKIYGGTMPDGHLISYDPQTGNFNDFGQVVAQPGIWSITTGNNGRIYIGGANGNFVSYDPRMAWNPGTTPDNNPRDYGVAVSGEDRIRCLTVGTDKLIYGGTAHHAHLFVFTPKPIINIHFVSYENGLPHPVDFTIFDVFKDYWSKSFYGVTDILTEVPSKFGYSYFYSSLERETRGYDAPFSSPPGIYGEFNFYCIDRLEDSRPRTGKVVFEPYGLPPTVSFSLSADTLITEISDIAGEGAIDFFTDSSFSTLPNFVLKSVTASDGIITEEIPGVGIYKTILGCRINWGPTVDHHPDLCDGTADFEITIRPWSSSSYIVRSVFQKIENNDGAIALYSIRNGEIPLPFELPKLSAVTSATTWDRPTHLYPQFVGVPGSYILSVKVDTAMVIDEDIVSSYKLALRLKNGVIQALEINSLRYSQIYPYPIYVLAKDPYASVTILNSIFDPENKIIEMDLSSTPRWDYCLAIVLPDSFVITNVCGYSSSESIPLSLNFDYTSFDVPGNRIYAITLTSEIDHLKINYGVYGNLDLKPEVLNLKSQGKWITGYIEILPPYNANDIDHTTVELCFGDQSVESEGPWSVGDYDNDGIPDLMVKFSREAIKGMLLAENIIPPLDIEFLARGSFIDGMKFAALGTIQVISPGGGPQEYGEEKTTRITFGINAIIPNFTASSVRIIYGINQSAIVNLKIYDASGRLTRKLMNEKKEIGIHTVDWDGFDEFGRKCSAGIYFVRLESQGASDVAKILLVR
ncbi:MAG: T9SS type A sorting domain-containing protein [candidate division WOR-3 bacterium]